MPKKTISEEQIAFALRQAEGGTAIGEICRKMNIAEATFYPIGVPAGIGLDAQRRPGWMTCVRWTSRCRKTDQ